MTRSRRHPLALVPVAVVVAFGASGCLFGQPTATPPTPISTVSSDPSASASVDPSASPSATSAPRNFRSDGVPPYLLNATLTELQADPGLVDVVPMDGCTGNVVARGVGSYGEVFLHFRADGRLYLLINRDRTLPTPSGIYLGDPLNDIPGGRKGLTTIYSDISLNPMQHNQGGVRAFSVRTADGNGILFILDENDLVIEMHSGRSTEMRAAFNAGSPFC